MLHVSINLHQTIYYTNAGYDLSFVTLSLSPRASYACPLVHQLSLSCWVQLFNNLNVLVYSHWGLRALSLFVKHWRHILCNTIFSATLPIVLLCNIMIGQIPLLPTIGWKYNGYCLVLFIVKSGESNYLNIQITTFRTSQVVFPPLYFTCVYWLCIF